MSTAPAAALSTAILIIAFLIILGSDFDAAIVFLATLCTAGCLCLSARTRSGQRSTSFLSR